MMPMTPLDWSVAAMRAASQVMGAQVRLAQVMYEAGLQQQSRLWGLRAPVFSAPTATMGVCGPVPLGGAHAGGRNAPTRLKLVSALPDAPRTRRRRTPSTPPAMPAPVATVGETDAPA
ncbi:hypothetical protein M4578_21210 [Salipiger sp. P9]|uniref:hypothetical protein n=1 Tax=Salipiger pentaromativorans TaxID=2943193 RepID=UPI002157A44E|nr:hypothetical protein [Salipiger pentaromativorans]MCR8550349.1 hypothetical protein [Salipiger pentaromativorans]